jgi:hypothetical protein
MGALLGATTYHFIASEEAEDAQPLRRKGSLRHRGNFEVAILWNEMNGFDKYSARPIIFPHS